VPQLLGQSLQKYSRKFLGAERFETFNRTIANTVAAAYGSDSEKIYQGMIAGDFGFDSLNQSDTAKSGDKTSDSSDFFSRIARIETEQVVGKQVSNPNASRLIGGYGIMFLLFALSGSATSLFEEKRSGIYHRILSAPVRFSHILWARFLFGVVLGVMQLTVLFLTGKVLYDIDLFSHAGPLLAMIVSAGAACTAFGMLVAAVSTSMEMATGLSTLLVLVMSAIGGAWFPISLLPAYIQHFSKLTIVYWSVEGFASVLWAGNSLVEILPTLGILLGIAAGVMALAIWCFKRSSMFD
jgi:ABC-2 type transport system permease protein